MAAPKYRKSKAKQRSRKAQWQKRMKEPPMGECGNCGSSKMPHRVCMNCGFYRGEQVIDVSEQSAES